MLFEPCGELRRDYGAYCETLRLTEREDIFSQVYTNIEMEKEKERKLQQQLQWEKMLAEEKEGKRGGEDLEKNSPRGGVSSPGMGSGPTLVPPGMEGGGGDAAAGLQEKGDGGSGVGGKRVGEATGEKGDPKTAPAGPGGGKTMPAGGGGKMMPGKGAGSLPPRASPRPDSRKKKGTSPASGGASGKHADPPKEESPLAAFAVVPKPTLTFVRVRYPKFCINKRDMTPLCRAMPYCPSLVSVEFIGAGLSVESYLLLTEAIFRSRRVVTVRIDFNSITKPGFVPDPTLAGSSTSAGGSVSSVSKSGIRFSVTAGSSGGEGTVGFSSQGGGGGGGGTANGTGNTATPSFPGANGTDTSAMSDSFRGRKGSGGGVGGGPNSHHNSGTPDRRVRSSRRRSSSASNLSTAAAAAQAAADATAAALKEEPGAIFLKPSEYCGLQFIPTPLEDQLQDEKDKKGKVDPKKLQLLQTQQEAIQRFNDLHRIRLPRSWEAMLFTGVVHLSLRGNGIDDWEVANMVRLLLRHSTSRLVSLNLWGNLVTDFGAKSIALLLRHNRTLRALDVGHNLIGNAGAIEIINAFRMMEMHSQEEIQAYRRRVLTRPNASEKERAAAQQSFSINAIPSYQDIFNVWFAQKCTANHAMMSNALQGNGMMNTTMGGGLHSTLPSVGPGSAATSAITLPIGAGGAAEEKTAGGGGGTSSKRSTSSKSSKGKEPPPPTLVRPTTPFDRDCIRLAPGDPCVRVPGNTVLEVLNLAENKGITLEGMREMVRILSLREPKTDEEMLGLTVRAPPPPPPPAMRLGRMSHTGFNGSHPGRLGASIGSTGAHTREESNGGAGDFMSGYGAATSNGGGGGSVENLRIGSSGGIGGGGGGGGGGGAAGASSSITSPFHSFHLPPSPMTLGSATTMNLTGMLLNASMGSRAHGGVAPSLAMTAVPTTSLAAASPGGPVMVYPPEVHCTGLQLRFCTLFHYRFSTEWKERKGSSGGEDGASSGGGGGSGGRGSGSTIPLQYFSMPTSGAPSTLLQGGGGGGESMMRMSTATSSPFPISTSPTTSPIRGGVDPGADVSALVVGRSSGFYGSTGTIPTGSTPNSTTTTRGKRTSPRNSAGGSPGGVVGSPGTPSRPPSHPSAAFPSSGKNSMSSGTIAVPVPHAGQGECGNGVGGGILPVIPIPHAGGGAGGGGALHGNAGEPERGGDAAGTMGGEGETGKRRSQEMTPRMGSVVSAGSITVEDLGEEISEWEAMTMEQEKLNKCLDEWLVSTLNALKPPVHEKSSTGRRKNH